MISDFPAILNSVYRDIVIYTDSVIYIVERLWEKKVPPSI